MGPFQRPARPQVIALRSSVVNGSAAHVDADLADRRMRQEVAAEDGVMVELDGPTLPEALDPLGAAAAGAVKAEPVAALLQPARDGTALHGVGIGTGHVGDEKLAH